MRNQNTEKKLDINGKEPEDIKSDRRILQHGQSVKSASGGMRRMKSRFLWLTEDMLFLRWNHGSEKNLEESDEKETLVEVANIGDVGVFGKKKDKKPFRFRVHLIDDPERELIFDVDSAEIRDTWIRCIKRLALGELDYQLVWDQRDAGTEISVHWRADDTWFPGVISGFDSLKNEHLLQFDDGKTRLYDLSRVFFRIVKLPDWRRDDAVYDFDVVHIADVAHATLEKHAAQQNARKPAVMTPPDDPPSLWRCSVTWCSYQAARGAVSVSTSSKQIAAKAHCGPQQSLQPLPMQRYHLFVKSHLYSM